MNPNTLSFAVPPMRHGREIVLLAEHEAHDQGNAFVDTEHLLAAAVLLCEGMPRMRTVLHQHGIAIGLVRAEMRVAFPDARVVDAEDRVTCTPAAFRVLGRAQFHAGPAAAVVRPAHVLLALLDGIDDDSFGSVPELLDRIDVDVRRFRRALRRAARRG